MKLKIALTKANALGTIHLVAFPVVLLTPCFEGMEQAILTIETLLRTNRKLNVGTNRSPRLQRRAHADFAAKSCGTYANTRAASRGCSRRPRDCTT